MADKLFKIPVCPEHVLPFACQMHYLELSAALPTKGLIADAFKSSIKLAHDLHPSLHTARSTESKKPFNLNLGKRRPRSWMCGQREPRSQAEKTWKLVDFVKKKIGERNWLDKET